MTIADRLRALPPRRRDRLRLAAECFLIQSAMIAATEVFGLGTWLWFLILFVGFTVIERRAKRYRRAWPKTPLTLELR